MLFRPRSRERLPRRTSKLGDSISEKLTNGSFYDIDKGVEPDFVISKYETMYDREKLVEFIHNLP